MKVYRDVTYRAPLGLDLYVPSSARALCVYLHGGGWRRGGRTEVPGVAQSWFFSRVASMGLAVASVSYRLSGEAVFPAQAADVADALDFLALNRDKYGISADRTVVWGFSAGGHLAALAALASIGEIRERHRIAAAVCWYPPTDLDALSKDIDDAGGQGDRGAGSREGQLVGGALDDLPEAVAVASPVRHVRPGAPPFLLLHGDADTAVPPRQSERLAEALTAAGAEATVELVPGASHMFPELDEEATMRLVRRSAEFLLPA